MKKSILLFGLLLAILTSCSINEIADSSRDFGPSPNIIYATIADEPGDVDTKVYADSKLRVLWNEDDYISYFAKTTYNGQYIFLGEDGDNAGSFAEVPNSNPHTGNDVSNHYAVYPYQLKTSLTNDEIIRFTLPAEQTYKKDSFGVGANTMASKTPTNELKFKNVGGYLSFKFYGEGISVSSITLKGNNGEKLAGKCTIDMSSGDPAVSMDQEKATEEITLTCDPPVALGSSSSDYVEFWMVVPPMTFSKGITFTVTTSDGGVWEKQTTASFDLPRNVKRSLPALEVEVEDEISPNQIIYYTSTDGSVVVPYKTDVFGANIISNTYENGRGVITFDGDVTSIGTYAFMGRSKLASISIPESVTSIGVEAFNSCEISSITIPESVSSIGHGAFVSCRKLSSIDIPESITRIESETFYLCSSLSSIVIPTSVTSIGESAFYNCSSLASISIPESVVSIEKSAFYYCRALSSVTLPSLLTIIEDNTFYGCENLSSVSIPSSVSSIGKSAFYGCSSLFSITIPAHVSSLGKYSFYYCGNLSFVTMNSTIPPVGADYMFDNNSNAPIYVPAGSVEEYKSAQYWRNYANRIQGLPLDGTFIPVFENVDM